MRIGLLLALVYAIASAVWGQAVLSAKSGTIQHLDGDATLSGKDLKPTPKGEFPAMKPGNTLQTKDARAEILLTPGVFLRLDEQSELEMVSNELTDTQVRLLAGSALVEVGEVLKDNKITVEVGNFTTSLTKTGLYRFDFSPTRVRVFEGKAEVASLTAPEAVVTLKKGRELTAGTEKAEKFNRKKADELYSWSSARSAIVAQANFVAARTANSRGYSTRTSQWVFLPSLGLYTFLPGRGIWASPFGYSFYSPSQVWVVYQPQTFGSGMGGMGGGPQMGGISRGGGNTYGGGMGAGGGAAPASSMGGTFGGAAGAGAPARGGGGMPSGGAGGRR